MLHLAQLYCRIWAANCGEVIVIGWWSGVVRRSKDGSKASSMRERQAAAGGLSILSRR